MAINTWRTYLNLTGLHLRTAPSIVYLAVSTVLNWLFVTESDLRHHFLPVPVMPGGSQRSGSASPRRLPIEEQTWTSHPKNIPYKGGVNSAANDTGVNDLHGYEQFRLEDDQKKIEQAEDPRTSSTTIFTFNKEDHTLGNLLRDQLLKNPRVLFAAYKVPHPLNATFELRVQTDGQIKPSEALKAACADIIKDLVLLQGRFRHEFEVFKLSKAGQGGSNGV